MTTTYNEDQLSLFGDTAPPDVRVHVCPTCHGHGTVTRTGPIPSAPARLTDPDTSHAASEHEPDVRRFSARSRQALLLAGFRVRPETALEAAYRLFPGAPVSTVEGCRRRVSDLHAAGFICDSGERRTNPGSSDEAIVWEITPAGLRALDYLGATGWSR